VDLDAFHELVSWVDHSMFIVTTGADGQRAGCLVGFLTQASINPPRLLVLISKANFTYRVARRADALAVHFLSTADYDVARLFAEQTGDEVDKFAQCEWDPGPSGTAVLHTKGWVAGRILERLDAGDHVAHLVEPIAAEVRPPRSADGERPLTFHQVRHFNPGHPS
jgi:flavin reductase (DIM6/NTAB) family NADH-FMN oxidoreductase RutF